jgi:hypothetical protein
VDNWEVGRSIPDRDKAFLFSTERRTAVAPHGERSPTPNTTARVRGVELPVTVHPSHSVGHITVGIQSRVGGTGNTGDATIGNNGDVRGGASVV